MSAADPDGFVFRCQACDYTAATGSGAVQHELTRHEGAQTCWRTIERGQSAKLSVHKVQAGFYELRRGGKRVGATATHPRVFPRYWWANIGDVTGTGKTRADAIADLIRREAAT